MSGVINMLEQSKRLYEIFNPKQIEIINYIINQMILERWEL